MLIQRAAIQQQQEAEPDGSEALGEFGDISQL